MKVSFFKRASREVMAIHAWWQENADHPETFANELADAEEHLMTSPESGTPWKIQRGKLIRRWILLKTKTHLYYRYERAQEKVVIVAVWDGRRGRPPKL